MNHAGNSIANIILCIRIFFISGTIVVLASNIGKLRQLRGHRVNLVNIDNMARRWCFGYRADS